MLLLKKVRLAEKRSSFGNKVEIVAVTKKKSFNDIIKDYDLGLRSIGENGLRKQ